MNRKDLPTKSGIYYIFCKANGRGYIGSSKNIKYRICGHFSSLRKGNHHNCHIQNTYNKYKEDSFEFKILCFCPEEYRLKLEQWFLDKSNLNIDLNIRKTVDGPYTFDDEQKNKNIKLNRNQVIKIIELINQEELSNTEIGNMFNVTSATIRGIQTGKTWQRWSHLIKPGLIDKRYVKLSYIKAELILNDLIETGNIVAAAKKYNITRQTVRSITTDTNYNFFSILQTKAIHAIKIRQPYIRYILPYNEYENIRNLMKEGLKNKQINILTGICMTTLSDIRYNKTYQVYNQTYLNNLKHDL